MQGLTDGPRSGLTTQEVEDTLNWDNGAVIRFGLDFLDEDGKLVTPYLSLDGSSAYAQTPHDSSFDTDDLDVRAHIRPDDWDGDNQTVVSRWRGSDRSWRLYLNDGKLRVAVRNPADDNTDFVSSDPIPSGAGGLWVRVTVDDEGAVEFFISDDGDSWDSHGTGTAGSGPLNAESIGIEVGSRGSGGNDLFEGQIFEVEVRDGSGTVIAHPEFHDQEPGDDSFDDDQGNTWDLEGGAEIADPTDVGVESIEVTWASQVSDDVTNPQTEEAEVRRTATVELKDVGEEFNPVKYRYSPWCEMLSPEGNWVEWRFGEFVSTMPDLHDDGVTVDCTLELADRTHIFSSEHLDEGLQVPMDTNVLLWIENDIDERFGDEDFDFPSASPTLDEDMFFDPDTPLLEVYNALLEAVGYDKLHMNEDGEPRTRHADQWLQTTSEWTYESGTTILPAGTRESLLSEIPNVITFVAARGPSLATEGWGKVTITNQKTGPASIDELGRESHHRVEVEAQDQDELERVAKSQAERFFAGAGHRYTGRVGLNPAHSDRDIITLKRPRLGMDDEVRYVVTEWSHRFKRLESEDDATTRLVCERVLDIDID